MEMLNGSLTGIAIGEALFKFLLVNCSKLFVFPHIVWYRGLFTLTGVFMSVVTLAL